MEIHKKEQQVLMEWFIGITYYIFLSISSKYQAVTLNRLLVNFIKKRESIWVFSMSLKKAKSPSNISKFCELK